MPDAVLKDKQRNGREAAVQHKQSITYEDWDKIKMCSKCVIPEVDYLHMGCDLKSLLFTRE